MNDYGFYNALGGVKTPHLDQFKKTALMFEKAYCASPACVPSLAAVFSGLYPHTTGACRNGCDPWTRAPLDSTESLPELFKRNQHIGPTAALWRSGCFRWSRAAQFASQRREWSLASTVLAVGA